MKNLNSDSEFKFFSLKTKSLQSKKIFLQQLLVQVSTSAVWFAFDLYLSVGWCLINLYLFAGWFSFGTYCWLAMAHRDRWEDTIVRLGRDNYQVSIFWQSGWIDRPALKFF